jgi:hypothetical protein
LASIACRLAIGSALLAVGVEVVVVEQPVIEPTARAAAEARARNLVFMAVSFQWCESQPIAGDLPERHDEIALKPRPGVAAGGRDRSTA